MEENISFSSFLLYQENNKNIRKIGSRPQIATFFCLYGGCGFEKLPFFLIHSPSTMDFVIQESLSLPRSPSKQKNVAI